MANRILTIRDIEALVDITNWLVEEVFDVCDGAPICITHQKTDSALTLYDADLILSDDDFKDNRLTPFFKYVHQKLSKPDVAPVEVKDTIVSPPDMSAVKHDADKDPWHLAPWDAFRAIVKVMGFGAKKYAPRNWEKGFDYSRLYRATIEHMNSWWMGEDKDPETGYSHLWHAGCCITFLIAHELRGIGKDDRPKNS